MSITPSKQTSVYRQVDAILKREDIYCGDKYIAMNNNFKHCHVYILVSTVYIFPFQNGVYLAKYTCLFRWRYGHFYNRLTQFIVYCSYVVCTILLRRPVDLSTHWTVTAISLHVTTFVGVCHE